MALNKIQLRTDLLQAYNDAKSGISESDFADKVSDAIDAYVRTALVTVVGVEPGVGSATGGLS